MGRVVRIGVFPGPGEGGFVRTFCGLAVIVERAE